jgi:tetratricopeptide (TPR) repeat protein
MKIFYLNIILFLIVNYSNAQNSFKIKFIDSIIDNQVKNQYDKALMLLSKKLEAEKNPKIVQVLYAKKAAILIDQNKINEAQNTINLAHKLCITENCYPEKSKLSFQQAALYFQKNETAKALEEILKNNLILQKYSPNTKELASSYSLTAYYYNTLENYQNAEIYLKKSLDLDRKINPKKDFASIYNNLGILSKKQKKWAKAIHFFKQTLHEDAKYKNFQNNIYTYNNISSVYLQIPKLDSAYHYLKKAKKSATKDELLNSSIYPNLCVYFSKRNQIDSTLYYGHQFLSNFSENNPNQYSKVEVVYNEFSQVFESNNRLDSSLFYQKKLLKLKEKQWNTTDKDEIVSKAEQKAQIKYQDQVIQALEQKNYFQNLSIKQNRILIFSIAIGFLLFLIALFLFYQRKKLKHQKKQIELEQKILRSQMNPHFIFNALTAIQNKVMENNPLHTATYISRFAKLIRQNFDFTQKELVTLEDDLDALKNYMATQQMRFENKFDYEFKIDKKLIPSFIKIPPMLLQPFVENAIEHGFKDISHKGKIEITVNQDNKERLQFKIIDNGKGFYPKSDDKLHALDIIKTRLKLNNSNDETTFIIKNRSETSGTEVSFLLTLAKITK